MRDRRTLVHFGAVVEGGWEDRSPDVSCPARPSAQELRELSSRRAYTLTRLALTLVGCGGLLEW